MCTWLKKRKIIKEKKKKKRNIIPDMFYGRIQGQKSGLEKFDLYPQIRNSMCRERDGRAGLLYMISAEPGLLRLRLQVILGTGTLKNLPLSLHVFRCK